MLVPLSALEAKIDMVRLPPVYFAWLALTLASCCVLTQLMKVGYMRRYGCWLQRRDVSYGASMPAGARERAPANIGSWLNRH